MPPKRPTDDEDEQVGRQHQDEHREDEDVHVGEEARDAAVLGHVPDRVHVDEEPDAGDDHDHEGAERVESEINPDAESAFAEVDPLPEVDGGRLAPSGAPTTCPSMRQATTNAARMPPLPTRLTAWRGGSRGPPAR